jgi:hypothetical protein
MESNESNRMNRIESNRIELNQIESNRIESNQSNRVKKMYARCTTSQINNSNKQVYKFPPSPPEFVTY